MDFNLFKTVRGLFSNDLSIDLGTANTLIYTKDIGIVLKIPERDVLYLLSALNQSRIVVVRNEI